MQKYFLTFEHFIGAITDIGFNGQIINISDMVTLLQEDLYFLQGTLIMLIKNLNLDF